MLEITGSPVGHNRVEWTRKEQGRAKRRGFDRHVKEQAGICIPSGSHHATIRIAVESMPGLVKLGLEFAAPQLIAQRIEIGDRLA